MLKLLKKVLDERGAQILRISALSTLAVPFASHAMQPDHRSSPTPQRLNEAPVWSEAEWREQARIDIAGFAEAMRQNYIYAVYPKPDQWNNWFDHTLAEVEARLPLVRDEAGYQALLKYFAATLRDQHVVIRFPAAARLPAKWPGFLARYDHDSYRITASRRPDVADGAQVSDCDGRPLSWWIATIAKLEVGLPDTLDTARNTAALRLFADRGSPLRPRPANPDISQ